MAAALLRPRRDVKAFIRTRRSRSRSTPWCSASTPIAAPNSSAVRKAIRAALDGASAAGCQWLVVRANQAGGLRRRSSTWHRMLPWSPARRAVSARRSPVGSGAPARHGDERRVHGRLRPDGLQRHLRRDQGVRAELQRGDRGRAARHGCAGPLRLPRFHADRVPGEGAHRRERGSRLLLDERRGRGGPGGPGGGAEHRPGERGHEQPRHPGAGIHATKPGGPRHRGLHEGPRRVTRWLAGVGLLISAAVATADEPPLPEVAAALARVKDRGTIELTTTGRHTRKPHTRPVWFVVSDSKVFLQAGRDGKTDWYRNLQQNPSVTLRAGTYTFRARAVALTDPARIEEIHRLFLRKYTTAWLLSFVGSSIGRGRPVEVTPWSVSEARP